MGSSRLASTLVAALVCSVNSYSSHPGNCNGPAHGAATALTTNSPYGIHIDSGSSTMSYSTGATYTITLNGTQTFSGFLLRATDSGNGFGKLPLHLYEPRFIMNHQFRPSLDSPSLLCM
jgi:hypothetical protein